jgi:transport and Golgi organization protein 2
MCTVVVSFEPGERAPLLLLGARDELMDRPWLPPARHWPGSPLIGGLDQQAGGTWLAVQPAVPRMSCLLNGRGAVADPAGRRSRGELPLRAAGEGAGVLRELADAPHVLAAYDPFHLVCANLGSVRLLSWDGRRAVTGDLAPGTHVLTNSGHAYPADPVTEPKAVHFGPKFAASRPSADPAVPAEKAWGDWLTLAAGDGLEPSDPRAIAARRELPDGRVWGTTSVSLVALASDGLRYDFQSRWGGDNGWHPVNVP